MKTLTGLVIVALFAGSAVSYLKYERPVQANGTGQHYALVDESIWSHARADLGDLRLFAGEAEVPYALIVASGNSRQQSRNVPVLQQSTVADKTQFLVDMSGLEAYDHIKLNLTTKNFVARAKVEGSNEPNGKSWATLGEGTLYDLSKEKLGSNSMLQMPRSKFAFLRVTIDSPVKPDEVQGATTDIGEEQPPIWREVGSAGEEEQSGKDTAITFDVAESVPVERVMLVVAPGTINFRREVEVQDEKGGRLGSGEISRIHMVREGQKIDTENGEIRFSSLGHSRLRLVIHNGDDLPLKLTGAHLQQLERRIYFESSAQANLALFYGDGKLDGPIYDYAKLFQQDRNATAAQLGSETANAAYAGRPDDRPWSERHPVLLWAAILAAVLVLGAQALRSMRSARTL